MMERDTVGGRVGIFWGVPDAGALRLLTDTTPLAEAEPYGEFLTHSAGHAETWEAWRALGPVTLARRGLPVAVAFHEYEDFPRGRVVFHRPSGWFTVYADQDLFKFRANLLAVFALPSARTRLRQDMHYRTNACLLATAVSICG